MPKYPWKCLNKLFCLCQGSEYAWSSYMFDRLLKMPQTLNKLGFRIRHSCICKRYVEFWMSDYGSIHLNNPWICLIMPYRPSICLNMTDYCWMSLNMPENAWISCSDYAKVLFFLTTMTSKLSKYLNEQMGTFLNVKQQKWS